MENNNLLRVRFRKISYRDHLQNSFKSSVKRELVCYWIECDRNNNYRDKQNTKEPTNI